MMIQPPGVPAVPRAPTSQGWTPLYDRWEACEAERVRLIQADILQERQPTPLVCQGLYSWWELVKRSSARAKRNRQ